MLMSKEEEVALALMGDTADKWGVGYGKCTCSRCRNIHYLKQDSKLGSTVHCLYCEKDFILVLPQKEKAKC